MDIKTHHHSGEFCQILVQLTVKHSETESFRPHPTDGITEVRLC